jgi:hypothetical protein
MPAANEVASRPILPSAMAAMVIDPGAFKTASDLAGTRTSTHDSLLLRDPCPVVNFYSRV